MKTVQRRTRDAFLLVLLVPAILGALTVWLERKSDADLKWVAHTQQVLRTVNRIVARAYQAESDQRGYLITRQQSFLDRYHAHSAEEQTEFARFQSLTTDNPVQQGNSAQLRQLWTLRSRHMDEVLAITPSLAVSSDTIRLMTEGRALMDQMTEVASRMSQEEMRLLRIRSARQKTTESETVILFVSGLIVNLLLLSWAYRLIKNYGLARDVAEMEIRRANSELEQRVQDRTAELQKVNEHLVRSNEDLTRFAYVASHDLQEPLRTVGSYAGLLARRYQGQLDDKADKYITFIVSGAKRMQHLVQDLLAYSRTGTQQLTFGPVDFNQLLENVRQDLRVSIAESGGKVIGDNLPVIAGDLSKLGLVLQNLVSNALKFRAPKRTPEVVVSAERQATEWVISVRDNGIGFDPQYAERIFVIFQRLHQVGEYAGTGIGLAISKRIVEGHGGRIWAESMPGTGSTFFFSLPNNLPVSAVPAALLPSVEEASSHSPQ